MATICPLSTSLSNIGKSTTHNKSYVLGLIKPNCLPYCNLIAPNKGVTRLYGPAEMMITSPSLAANSLIKATFSSSERNFTKEPSNSPFSFLRTAKPPKPNFLASNVKLSITLRLVSLATPGMHKPLIASALR